MERIFAIGDIHGCSKTFEKILIDQIQLQKEDLLYCIGDYIDRGEDSKGVIDLILKLRSEGFHIYTLRGNHEQMMIEAHDDKQALKLWLDNGGKSTLRSFGIKSLDDLPEKYFTFLTETEYYLQKNNYIFAHAGLNFERENILEDKEAMLWARGFYPQQPKLEDKLLIHGHTPIPLAFIIKQTGNCVNIDGGCVYTKRPNMGNLIAVDVNNRQFIIEKNCES